MIDRGRSVCAFHASAQLIATTWALRTFGTARSQFRTLLSRSAHVYRRRVKIEHGRRVTLKVELSVVGGATLEKSTVEYIHGAGTMLPGLETVLTGLEKGARREGVIKAKDAFGDPSMHPLKKMKRTEFPRDVKLEVGEKLVAKGAHDMNVVLRIEKVAGDEVDVRLVHPLAEKDIRYSAEVIQVSDPRPPPVPAQALELEEDS
jgi:FKBP-type peptidyl-prolyl cis-trans isomerase SlyD